MSIQKDIIDVCAYFFEVLIKQYIELERAIQKQSGLLSLFKKIDYPNRANAFESLMGMAMEAREDLPLNDEIIADYDLYTLGAKLSECFSLYINMVDAQVRINFDLNRKANGEKYNWDEYTKINKHFDMLRNSMEAELPKLQALYATALLKNQQDTKVEDCRVAIKINQLAELVISEYLTDLESNFASILSGLQDLGFDYNDFEDEGWMKYDILLCGLSLDGMALFNLLDYSLANRIFKYINVEKFGSLDNKDQADYSISEVAEYKEIWESCIEKSEPPLDFVFSKLLSNLLGDNISKYDIGPLHMMQLISMIMPIFAGKWKKALDRYNPV